MINKFFKKNKKRLTCELALEEVFDLEEFYIIERIFHVGLIVVNDTELRKNLRPSLRNFFLDNDEKIDQMCHLLTMLKETWNFPEGESILNDKEYRATTGPVVPEKF